MAAIQNIRQPRTIISQIGIRIWGANFSLFANSRSAETSKSLWEFLYSTIDIDAKPSVLVALGSAAFLAVLVPSMRINAASDTRKMAAMDWKIISK